MSHIVSFKIGNLAGRSTTIEHSLDRHLNVFYGLNGSGKTSLLKILQSAMSGQAESIVDVPFASAEVTIHSIKYNLDLIRTFQRPSSTTAATPTAQFVSASTVSRSEMSLAQTHRVATAFWTQKPLIKGVPAEQQYTSWRHAYLPTARLHIGAGATTTLATFGPGQFATPTNLTERQLDELAAASILNLWTAYSADVLSNVKRVQEEGLARILEKVLIGGTEDGRAAGVEIDPREAYDSLRAFLSRQASKVQVGSFEEFKHRLSEQEFTRVVMDIYRVEQETKRYLAPQEAFQSLVGRFFSGGKTVKLDQAAIHVVNQNSQEIGIPSLSSGEKHLLRILVDCLLIQENCMIIDEPELSLHIDWQHQLISAMRTLNPNAQLIIATHSPEVLADVPQENVIQL